MKEPIDPAEPARDLGLLGFLNNVRKRVFNPIAGWIDPLIGRNGNGSTKVYTETAKSQGDVERGKPEVALGAARLGLLVDYIAQARYYLAEEEYARCFECLDMVFLANPKRVKAHFATTPMAVVYNRIRDYEGYRFENYEIYDVWLDSRARVTNKAYFAGRFPRDRVREFEVRRGRCIAHDTAYEFIGAFFDALEEEGYDLPVTSRWSMADSDRASREFEERRHGDDKDSTADD